MQVAGRVAQFGRGIMQDVAEEMMNRFSTCLEQEIVGGGAEEEPAQEADASEQRPQHTARSVDRQSEPDPSSRGAEPLDVGSISRGALVKRAAPILGGLVSFGLLAVLVRRVARPSLSIKFEIRKS
jgi:hypothetical protein